MKKEIRNRVMKEKDDEKKLGKKLLKKQNIVHFAEPPKNICVLKLKRAMVDGIYITCYVKTAKLGDRSTQFIFQELPKNGT